MKRIYSSLTLLAALQAASAQGANILAPGDFIIAIDRDVSDTSVSSSRYPGNERPSMHWIKTRRQSI